MGSEGRIGGELSLWHSYIHKSKIMIDMITKFPAYMTHDSGTILVKDHYWNGGINRNIGRATDLHGI